MAGAVRSHGLICPHCPQSPHQVVRGRFTNIGLVSALVGGLAQVHDSLGIAFVDQVLEDIRWGLENPLLGECRGSEDACP